MKNEVKKYNEFAIIHSRKCLGSKNTIRNITCETPFFGGAQKLLGSGAVAWGKSGDLEVLCHIKYFTLN